MKVRCSDRRRRKTEPQLWIAVVTDKGIVAYVRTFLSEVKAENALIRYLKEHYRYRGPKHMESVNEWLMEQPDVSAEIVDQDSLD